MSASLAISSWPDMAIRADRSPRAECRHAMLQRLQLARQMPHDRVGADANRKADADEGGQPAQMTQAARFVPWADRDQPAAVLQRDAEKAAPAPPDRAVAALALKLGG